MKVLCLVPLRIRTAFTGDATQVHNTVKAIRLSGRVDLSLYYLSDNASLIDEAGRGEAGPLCEIVRQYDIIHLFPKPLYPLYRRIAGALAGKPVVFSTVAWLDSDRIRVAWRGRDSFTSGIREVFGYLKQFILKYVFSIAGDVILPNSWSEGENFQQHFKLRPGIVSIPVVNGIIPPQDVLPGKPYGAPSAKVPFEDYIVCPAAFARRKNQLSLILAIRELDIPVVFLGNPIASGEVYLETCRRQASGKMLFLGYHSSASREYWQIISHARCACLPSDCETPGIALLEAAYTGARPVITANGGTREYYGLDAEYLSPASIMSIRKAVQSAWQRGRLSEYEAARYAFFSWQLAGRQTEKAYRIALNSHSAKSCREID